MGACRAIISRDHLLHNFQIIVKQAGNSRILAMIKAEAYGHGLVSVARILSSADAFGVARVDEAIALRQAGIDKSIVLMSGFLDESELKAVVQYQLDVVIHDKQQLDGLLSSTMRLPAKLWLKIDTGMHRLGVSPDALPVMMTAIKQAGIEDSQLVLMTHIACADNEASDMTERQLDCFYQATKPYDHAKSIANSAAMFRFPQARHDWVRPGIMLYGATPIVNKSAADFGLLPVMTLQSHVVAVKHIRQNESVGYCAQWRSDRDTHIGVIAIGYGDGYPRQAATGTPVLINGMLYPLVGRVSMDLITVDLGVEASVQVGDCVTLWGEGLSVDQVAQHCETIGYELLSHLTLRVERIVV